MPVDPLFTASRGFALLDTTPAHVAADLAGEVEREDSDVMDLGTIVHGVLLTGEANVELLDYPDWRRAEARALRDQARREGKTPLLRHKWATVKTMVTVARRRLEAHEPPTPFVAGDAEKSLFFELDGVACRATPDWVYRDHTLIVDLKTTGASAHPAAFSKTIWGNGYAFQSAFYRRAVKAVYGVTAEFKWVALETFPPYALSMVALDPEAEAFADSQVTEALRLWKQCRETGEWPGYPTRTAYAELPGWLQAQWAERAYYQEASR